MCFVILPGQTLRTAKQDIVCYKTGYRRDAETFSPFYKIFFKYRLGEVTKLPYEKWPVEYEAHPYTICVGFHSFSNRKKLKKYLNVTCVKCIIPKGSRYYYNREAKEYVSDQIIVQEFMP